MSDIAQDKPMPPWLRCPWRILRHPIALLITFALLAADVARMDTGPANRTLAREVFRGSWRGHSTPAALGLEFYRRNGEIIAFDPWESNEVLPTDEPLGSISTFLSGHSTGPWAPLLRHIRRSPTSHLPNMTKPDLDLVWQMHDEWMHADTYPWEAEVREHARRAWAGETASVTLIVEGVYHNLIVLALLAIFAASSMYLLHRLMRWYAQRRAVREGNCSACGYELAGLPSDVCPECGASGQGTSGPG